MTGSQHSSPGDIQFQLVRGRGQCAKSSYLNPISTGGGGGGGGFHPNFLFPVTFSFLNRFSLNLVTFAKI